MRKTKILFALSSSIMLCSCQLTPNTEHFTSPNSREWSTVSSKTDEEGYTTNGGGDSGALCGIAGLLHEAGADYMMNDTVNKYRSSNHVKIDVNLDGK